MTIITAAEAKETPKEPQPQPPTVPVEAKRMNWAFTKKTRQSERGWWQQPINRLCNHTGGKV